MGQRPCGAGTRDARRREQDESRFTRRRGFKAGAAPPIGGGDWIPTCNGFTKLQLYCTNCCTKTAAYTCIWIGTSVTTQRPFLTKCLGKIISETKSFGNVQRLSRASLRSGETVTIFSYFTRKGFRTLFPCSLASIPSRRRSTFPIKMNAAYFSRCQFLEAESVVGKPENLGVDSILTS
jgi:hypothetical protein